MHVGGLQISCGNRELSFSHVIIIEQPSIAKIKIPVKTRQGISDCLKTLGEK